MARAFRRHWRLTPVMITGMRWRVAGVLVVAAAACAALLPSQSACVERYYARGWYPVVQRGLTTASNAVPFALIDLLLIAALAVAAMAVASVIRGSRGTRLRTLARRAWQGTALASLAYLAFVGMWGCNYRREAVSAWLDFDESRVTTSAVRSLNQQAVTELNRLRGRLPAAPEEWPARDAMLRGLEPALARGVRLLGLPAPVRAGRPKTSALDLYFTRAGVSGMTDPFFLETLVATNVLPFEQPAVIAHEWGHLAGLARESDASFFGWVVCLQGNEDAQYSAWLETFLHTLPALERDERRDVLRRLPDLVQADLDAMARRTARDQVRAVSLTAWRVYDRYLRANRVGTGVRNYGEVVRLMAGTRFGPGWRPVLRSQR
jgi:hypothetical protein